MNATASDHTLRENLLASTAAPKSLLDTEELLTLPETCRVTRLSRPTLYRHLAAGTLTGIKLGKRTMFRTEDVRRFMSGKAWERSNAAA